MKKIERQALERAYNLIKRDGKLDVAEKHYDEFTKSERKVLVIMHKDKTMEQKFRQINKEKKVQE